MGLFVRHNTDIVPQAGFVKGYLACSYRLLKVKRFMAVLNPKASQNFTLSVSLACGHLIYLQSATALCHSKNMHRWKNCKGFQSQ